MGEAPLTAREAAEMGEGIREEWRVLASLLEEAQDRQPWVTAGYDHPAQWIGELPPLPDLAAYLGPIAAGPIEANRRQARASRPGANRDTRATRRAGLR